MRRAFLAGVDEKSGKDFSFRREWIRRRMEGLASVFGIDVLTYAIMVLALAGNAERMAEIRTRMSDISWFMGALCEPIARMANRQDECTGRFWEGRFNALRLADETGLLACAMYVELNERPWHSRLTKLSTRRPMIGFRPARSRHAGQGQSGPRAVRCEAVSWWIAPRASSSSAASSASENVDSSPVP